MIFAKFETVCGNCDEMIERHQPIHQTLNGWVHVTCPEPVEFVLADVIPMHPVCQRCFCRHAGEC